MKYRSDLLIEEYSATSEWWRLTFSYSAFVAVYFRSRSRASTGLSACMLKTLFRKDIDRTSLSSVRLRDCAVPIAYVTQNQLREVVYKKPGRKWNMWLRKAKERFTKQM
ncbi:uncharacterized protein LOC126883183 [Diabrotica virgifera virgifera]|uniref:Uncharacterized protein n=1 Tax=Diabrotica virgifera virgifera TaxID=50390 RepID=A0ABM5K2G7_DIAVI|nr:uncharacterized protein LOC126883183 [Diabrotica virgifera virgifera]